MLSIEMHTLSNTKTSIAIPIFLVIRDSNWFNMNGKAKKGGNKLRCKQCQIGIAVLLP